jgi:hypothetical protein
LVIIILTETPEVDKVTFSFLAEVVRPGRFWAFLHFCVFL